MFKFLRLAFGTAGAGGRTGTAAVPPGGPPAAERFCKLKLEREARPGRHHGGATHAPASCQVDSLSQRPGAWRETSNVTSRRRGYGDEGSPTGKLSVLRGATGNFSGKAPHLRPRRVTSPTSGLN